MHVLIVTRPGSVLGAGHQREALELFLSRIFTSLKFRYQFRYQFAGIPATMKAPVGHKLCPWTWELLTISEDLPLGLPPLPVGDVSPSAPSLTIPALTDLFSLA